MRLPVLGSMMRLRSELSGLTESRWTLRELEQLAYPTAVIMEALRLNPGLATRLARILFCSRRESIRFMNCTHPYIGTADKSSAQNNI